MPDDKLPIPQFAAKIKAKYPQYKDINDTVLVQKIVSKYPEYESQVDLSGVQESVKKKELGSLLGGMAGNGLSQSNGKVLEKKQGNIQDESVGFAKGWQDIQSHKFKKSDKEIEDEAVNRLKGISPENIYFTPQPETSKIYEKQDDPIGNQVRKLQHEKDNLVKNTKNPENVFVLNELAVKDKQADLLKKYSIEDGNKAGFIVKQFVDKNIGGDSGNINNIPLEEIHKNLPADNITAQSAFEKYAKKRHIDEVNNQYGSFDDMVAHLYGGKEKSELPEAKLGQYIDQALNDPDIIEKTKESADFANKYRQAQFDLYRNYPSYGFKKVSEMISQKLEDKGMLGWLYSNPSLKKVETAIEYLKKDGVWGYKEDELFKEKLLPYIAMGAADKVLTLPDAAHQFGYGVSEGAKGFEASGRDIVNKLSGGFIDPSGNGLFQNLGLMEKNEDRAKRLEQEAAATPTVEPKRFVSKLFGGAAAFAGQMTPLILGNAVGIPNRVNLTMMFEGHNADKAREISKDVGVQNIYTLLTTTGDVFGMELLPTKKAASAFKSLFDKDVQLVVRDLADKKITQEVAKKTLTDRAMGYAKRLGMHNTTTAAVLQGYNSFHNGMEAAFGGRKFNVENELNEALSNYPTNWLNSTFLSALAAHKGGEQPINGQMYKRLADNADYYRDIINKDNTLSPIEKQDRLDKLDHLEAINSLLGKRDLKRGQVEKYLSKTMQQFVAEKAVKESADKILAKEDERKAAIAEVEKEHILNPMSNTTLVENLYEHLPRGSQEKLTTDKKFDKTKVAPYLEYIAKQSNGLDENWKPHEDGRIPKMTGIPESIIKAANEKFEKEIESSQEPLKEETPPTGLRRGDGFKQAGEKARETGDATHIGRWMLDNSQKGDVVRFGDGGYEVTEVNTRKDGTKELVLTPFEFNEDGTKDYNNTGIKLISEQSIKNGSNLFENAYTNSKGERVIEQSTYEAKDQSLSSNTPSQAQPKAGSGGVGGDEGSIANKVEHEVGDLVSYKGEPVKGEDWRVVKVNTNGTLRIEPKFNAKPYDAVTIDIGQVELIRSAKDLKIGQLENSIRDYTAKRDAEKKQSDKKFWQDSIDKAQEELNRLSQKFTQFETKSVSKGDGFDYVRSKFSQEGGGGKRLSDKESIILNKVIDKLIERAEKENGVKRNELKQATWKTNDGYTVTEFFENGRGGTRIITPKGEEINLFNNKYKGESGQDISYFSEAHKAPSLSSNTPSKEQTASPVSGGEGGDVVRHQGIKSSWESNIESLVHPETGLAAVTKKILDTQQPLKDAFLKRKGLTIDDYRKLSTEEKENIQKEWVKSKEFEQLNEQEQSTKVEGGDVVGIVDLKSAKENGFDFKFDEDITIGGDKAIKVIVYDKKLGSFDSATYRLEDGNKKYDKNEVKASLQKWALKRINEANLQNKQNESNKATQESQNDGSKSSRESKENVQSTPKLDEKRQVVEIVDWDLPTDELSRNAAYIPIKAGMLNGDIIAINKNGEQMDIKSPRQTASKTHSSQYHPDIDYFKAKTDKGKEILSQLNAEYVAREIAAKEQSTKVEEQPPIKNEITTNQEHEAKIQELDAEREGKVKEALKPELPEVKFKTADDIKGMAKGNPKEFKRIAKEQGRIKKALKQLENITDCLWP